MANDTHHDDKTPSDHQAVNGDGELYGVLAEFDTPGELVGATRWLRQQPALARLGVGYFGASTGGAAALVAAAELPGDVQAVVSRGGRPDLAGPALRHVTVPTLFIVGELDHLVLQLNREAYARLLCPKRLEIVPGATHLFEESGALEQVSRLATSWFKKRLFRVPQ